MRLNWKLFWTPLGCVTTSTCYRNYNSNHCLYFSKAINWNFVYNIVGGRPNHINTTYRLANFPEFNPSILSCKEISPFLFQNTIHSGNLVSNESVEISVTQFIFRKIIPILTYVNAAHQLADLLQNSNLSALILWLSFWLPLLIYHYFTVSQIATETG